MRKTTRPGAMMAAAVLTGALAAPWLQGIQEVQADPSDWRGRPSIEFTDPRVERTGTLRIVRFGTDPAKTLDDQGTVVGWTRAAVEGKVKPNHEQIPYEETIEIIERSEAKSIGTKK